MRIIAGKFKGKKIEFVSNEKTRPTSDMVREGLFSKIQFDLPNSIFLDLFAGSGGIGFEALSRGAKQVYFVEKDRKNFEIIKKNLKILYGENYEKSLNEQNQKVHLINSDFSTFLDKISPPFNFVYLDPPYKSGFYDIALQKMKENNLITNESMVICEHETSSPFINDAILKNYELIAQKRYGSKMLSYLKFI